MVIQISTAIQSEVIRSSQQFGYSNQPVPIPAKVARYAPHLNEAHGATAEAYQLRYLARRAVRSGEGKAALALMAEAMDVSPRILRDEPKADAGDAWRSGRGFGIAACCFEPVRSKPDCRSAAV